MNRPSSAALLAANARFIPGGMVSLNRRVQPEIAFVRGSGQWLWDADGRAYLDYHAAFGPYLLGHGDPDVEDAVIRSIQAGQTLTGSGTTPWEGEAAELLCACVPTIDQAVFTNTGSEATYLAIRLARAATGRQHVAVMQGGYNGWHDHVACNVMTPLAEAGPRTFDGEYRFVGMSAGMAEETPAYVHVLEFNSLEAVEALFQRQPVACLITEPILQNIGVVRPKPGYLAGLQALCQKHGVVLVMDEVKTGFRHALAGYHSLEGIRPDLVVFGKAIANGYPVGAMGGRRTLMDLICHPEPARRVMVAGTYNGHPVPMAAAIATMKKLRENEAEIYPRLDALGERLARGLEAAFADAGLPCTVARQASALAPYLMDREPESWHDLAENHDMGADLRFRQAMVERGHYFLPLATKQISISLAHTQEDIDRTIEAAREAVREEVKPHWSQPGLLFRRPNLHDLPPLAPPEGVEIRPILPGEEEQAGAALGLAFQDEWGADKVRRELSANPFVKTMFVAVKGGEVVATASAASSQEWGSAGYVHYVAVHPGHQGLRLGYWVTLACLHEFQRLGMESSVLHTDDWRLPAIKTYLRLGFRLDTDAHVSYRRRWRAILPQLEPAP